MDRRDEATVGRLLAAGLALLALVPACAGSDGGAKGGGGGTGADGAIDLPTGDGGLVGGEGGSGEGGAGAGFAGPPKRAGGTPTSERHVFAVHRVFLGDTPRFDGGDAGFVPDREAWKAYGYDLDGVLTTDEDSVSCAPRAGRPVVDGPRGIDNAFGAKLLPQLIANLRSFAVPSAGITAAHERGEGTFLFDVVGLSDDAAQNAEGLRIDFATSGSGGVPGGGPPAWDGRDEWSVVTSSLVDGTLAGGAKVRFSGGFVAGGTLVSGEPSSFTFTLRLRGTVAGSPNYDLPFKIRSGYITARHVPARAGRPRRLEDGLIVGRIRRDDILQTLDGALANAGQCTYAGLVSTLLNGMYDLVPQGTPATASCDELSFAIGFDAVEVSAPTRVEIATTPDAGSCSTP